MLFGYLNDMIKRHDSEEQIFFISFSKNKTWKDININVTYCTA